VTEGAAPEGASESVSEFSRRAREWVEANLEPTDKELTDAPEHTAEYLAPERALQSRLYAAGFAGITWPKEYGGQGLTNAHEHAFNEAARGYRLPNFGALGRTTFGICIPTMLAYASPAFLAEHLPKVAVGDELWVQFFSEPEAGSDLAGVRTRAVRDGDRWLLSGSKIWSSGAYYADYGLCLARTNWEVPKHRGLTWFAVKADKPGVTIQRIRQINGNAEFCQEFFDNVELADEDVVGAVDAGWTVARTMLITERGGGSRGAAVAVEPIQHLAPDLVALASGLGRDGEAEVRQAIARAHVNDVVQAELTKRVLALSDAKVADPSSLAAYIKLALGTFTPWRARIGMQVGRGATVAWPAGTEDAADAAGAYLSARGQSIAGGTNEMMRNVISERMLDLPREISFDADRPFSEVLRRAAEWTGSGQARNGRSL
jgi:alkylation response protein AidB-like acyl-CoA dehydrogenase